MAAHLHSDLYADLLKNTLLLMQLSGCGISILYSKIVYWLISLCNINILEFCKFISNHYYSHFAYRINWSKAKIFDRTFCKLYLWPGPTVQVLSTPWADSTVVPGARVNCHLLCHFTGKKSTSRETSRPLHRKMRLHCKWQSSV